MKKLLLLPILALLLAAMVSCEKDEATPTDGTEAVRPVASIPFNGVYTTYPQFIRMDDKGTQTYQIPSEGKAIPLGNSTWYSDSKVWNTATDKDGPWTQTGTSIFTAADGSQLIGAFEGTAGPTEESPIAGSGTFWIDYGTQSLEGTTGSGTYTYSVISADPATGELVGQLEFTGTLVNAERQDEGSQADPAGQRQGPTTMPPPTRIPK